MNHDKRKGWVLDIDDYKTTKDFDYLKLYRIDKKGRRKTDDYKRCITFIFEILSKVIYNRKHWCMYVIYRAIIKNLILHVVVVLTYSLKVMAILVVANL